MTLSEAQMRQRREAASKGGRAKGASKLRGDSEYYRRISQLAAEARKRNREAREAARNEEDQSS